MKHVLNFNIQKDSFKSVVETMLSCLKEDENVMHEYVLHLWDNEDTTEASDILNFDTFLDASRTMSAVYRALRKGYEQGYEDGYNKGYDEK